MSTPSGRLAALTGGTGFLGRYIALALDRAGWRLRLLVRSEPVHPQTAALDPEIVLGELGDARALAQLCRGADAVVHAAGLIRARDRAAFFAINEGGSARLAAAAAGAAPGATLVVVSSLAAREPALSDYAASKRAGEEAARAAAGGPVVVLRPPVLYGPWDRETLALFRAVGRPLVPLPPDRGARVTFLHASDAAAAVAAAAGGAPGDGPYELSDERPEGYSWREIAGTAARAVGRRPRLVPLPRRAWLAAGALAEAGARLSGQAPMLSRGKAREMLHRDWSVRPDRRLRPPLWSPQVDLARGFGETVAWYRGAGWLAGPCDVTAATAVKEADGRCS